jgi:hypothetical protein
MPENPDNPNTEEKLQANDSAAIARINELSAAGDTEGVISEINRIGLSTHIDPATGDLTIARSEQDLEKALTDDRERQAGDLARRDERDLAISMSKEGYSSVRRLTNVSAAGLVNSLDMKHSIPISNLSDAQIKKSLELYSKWFIEAQEDGDRTKAGRIVGKINELQGVLKARELGQASQSTHRSAVISNDYDVSRPSLTRETLRSEIDRQSQQGESALDRFLRESRDKGPEHIQTMIEQGRDEEVGAIMEELVTSIKTTTKEASKARANHDLEGAKRAQDQLKKLKEISRRLTPPDANTPRSGSEDEGRHLFQALLKAQREGNTEEAERIKAKMSELTQERVQTLIKLNEKQLEIAEKAKKWVLEKGIGSPRLHSALERCIQNKRADIKQLNETGISRVEHTTDSHFLLVHKTGEDDQISTAEFPFIWAEHSALESDQFFDGELLINPITALTLTSTATTPEDFFIHLNDFLNQLYSLQIHGDVALNEMAQFGKSATAYGNPERRDLHFNLDKEVVLWHVFNGANKAFGHPERDPMDRDHRLETLWDLESHPLATEKIKKLLIEGNLKLGEDPHSPESNFACMEETAGNARHWRERRGFKHSPIDEALDLHSKAAAKAAKSPVSGLAEFTKELRKRCFSTASPHREKFTECLPTESLEHYMVIWSELDFEPDSIDNIQKFQILFCRILSEISTNNLDEDSDKSPYFQFLTQMSGFIATIQHMNGKHPSSRHLNGLEWPKTFKMLRQREGSPVDLTLGADPKTKYRIDEQALLYHIFQGFFTASGQPHRSVQDAQDRTWARQEIARLRQTDEFEGESIMKDLNRLILPELLDRAEIMFGEEVPEAQRQEIEQNFRFNLDKLEAWLEERDLLSEAYRKAIQNARELGADDLKFTEGVGEPYFEGIIFPSGMFIEKYADEKIGNCAGIWSTYKTNSSDAKKKDGYAQTSLRQVEELLHRLISNEETLDDNNFRELFTQFVFRTHTLKRHCKIMAMPWETALQKLNLDMNIDNQKLDKNATIHVDETIMIYRLLETLNQLAGHPERNPRKRSDRQETLQEMLNAYSGNEDVRNELMREILPEICKRADQLFPSPFDSYDHLEEFAKAVFDQKKNGKGKKGGRKKRSRGGKPRNDIDHRFADIEAAIESCLNLSVYVPHDIKGFVTNIAELRSTKRLLSCYIEHNNPDGIVYPPNLACHGHFDIEFANRTHRLKWTLGNNAILSLDVEGASWEEEYFTSPHARGMILEMKRIILRGLEDRLIRETRDIETQRVHHITGGQSAKPIALRGTSGKPVKVRPRVDKMFQNSGQKNPDPAPPPLSATAKLVANTLERMKSGTVTEASIKPITLYVKKTFTIKTGTIKRGEDKGKDREKEIDIHFPVETMDVLMEIHNGNLDPQDIYLNTSTRTMVKAGYHPQKLVDEEDTPVLSCKPRTQSLESQERLRVTTKALGIQLSAEGLKDRTEIKIPSNTERVILNPPEGIIDAAQVQIQMAEIVEFLEAAERSEEPAHAHIEAVEAQKPGTEIDEVQLSTRERITKVAFRAPQNPQFRKGEFVSLASEMERLSA